MKLPIELLVRQIGAVAVAVAVAEVRAGVVVGGGVEATDALE